MSGNIPRLSSTDPSSFSNPEKCKVIKIDLNLDVDFERKILLGNVRLTFDLVDKKCKSVILDTRDVTVKGVTDCSAGQTLKYTVGEPVGNFGAPLEIDLPESLDKPMIQIDYETTPQCSALQWLSKEQTAGKRHPYLFSQCQAIHCRSLVPCQDTPSVKSPYTAKISAPKEITVLMSAVHQKTAPHDTDATKLIHCFEQSVPVPSYLIAIVGGDLESRELSARCKVWSEKEFVEQAAYEFAQTETMLQVAEDLMGPYVWGRYDLLVLPPSFPYGGMENPCLTFVTPTLLAGDRSLADVVAHEITHSWTGNLVTNANPEHFWLNEGHTVFVERKIAARLGDGEPMRHFKSNGGWDTLSETVKKLDKSMYSRLVPDLTGEDPDDAFSSVPYEKGSCFLFYLESLVGGPEKFNPFLKAYIEEFKKMSIVTEDWTKCLLSFFKNEVKAGVFDNVDWEAWFYGEGMPPFKPNYDMSYGQPCQQLAQRWISADEGSMDQFSLDEYNRLSPIQKIQFLSLLCQQDPLSVKKVETLEKAYGLNAVKNSEIRHNWLRLCIKAKWEPCIDQALRFVSEQGRMKFVLPIYRDLEEWDSARPRAIENFNNQKAFMHSTCVAKVNKILKLT